MTLFVIFPGREPPLTCITCFIMTKRTDNIITNQFTGRVHKQHNSLVITLPKGLCEVLNISKGQYILFEVVPGAVVAVMGKVALKGVEDGGNN